MEPAGILPVVLKIEKIFSTVSRGLWSSCCGCRFDYDLMHFLHFYGAVMMRDLSSIPSPQKAIHTWMRNVKGWMDD